MLKNLSSNPELKVEGQVNYRLPVGVRIARRILRPLFRFIFRLISKVEIVGVENIPHNGGYLIAANHVSLYDPPLVIAFWPVAAEAAGAADVWQRAGQAQLVSWYGVLPVHRGAYDRQLLDKMRASLTSGRPVMIMPEGGRSHKPGMRHGEPGAAYIVEKTQVKVVPVGVTGTTDDFLKRALRGKRPQVKMVVGKPFDLPPVQGRGEERRRLRQRNTDLIMSCIAALLPEEYRGVYA